MPAKAWFPTLIYESVLDRKGDGAAAFNRELLAECLQIREIDDEGRKWSRKHYPEGFTSYGSMCHLHRMSPVFADLDERVARHVRSFARSLDLDLEGRPLEMTDCWVNVMPRHAAHGLHLHPTSTISGTYYVKTPKGSSSIRFEDPRLSKLMAAPPRKPNARNANLTSVEYPAQAGHVILFESWLRHEVRANRTQGERVSVSFNYSWF